MIWTIVATMEDGTLNLKQYRAETINAALMSWASELATPGMTTRKRADYLDTMGIIRPSFMERNVWGFPTTLGDGRRAIVTIVKTAED